MIKRTDNEVVCYHEKFRSIDYGDNLGVWLQCQDCSDTYSVDDTIKPFTTYEPEFFDDLKKGNTAQLEVLRKDSKVKIIENYKTLNF